MAEAFVRLTDPYGQNGIDVGDFLDADGPGLEYTLSCGKVGAASMTLPPSFDVSLLPKDARLHIMRSVGGASPKREGDAAYLIRAWKFRREYTKVLALHANCLLTRRIVAYRSNAPSDAFGHFFTTKTEFGDDFIKRITRENAGDLIDLAQRLGDQTRADMRPYLTVEPLTSKSVNITLSFPLQQLGEAARDVMQAVQQDSPDAPEFWAIYEVVAPSEDTLELRTYASWRGEDHSPQSGQSVIFSEARGNLENAEVEIDATSEATFVLAAGAGKGSDRVYGSAIALPGDSPFDRIEALIEVNTTDTAALDAAAAAELRARRPVMTLTADMIDTNKAQRGVDFDYGDLVGIDHPRWPSDRARLDVVHISWQGGKETTKVQFRSF